MTQAAKLKTVIRARAQKTGESYTTARRHVLASKSKPAPKPVVAKAEPLPVETSPALPKKDPRVPRGELSDKTCIKSTGKNLAHWFGVLDAFGKANGHTKAAEYLYAEHKIQAWHAQMITITWERARGLRQENQSCTGTFQVSVSRSLAASVDWVVGFFNDADARAVWLKSTTPALRKALEEAFAAGKTMESKKKDYARMRYKWFSSIVELRVYGKPDGKCSLTADSSDLADAEAVAARRTAFSEALDRLRDIAQARPIRTKGAA
jgi:hypothetical protein